MMPLTDEDKAFLIKIGQELPQEPAPKPTPTKEKEA